MAHAVDFLLTQTVFSRLTPTYKPPSYPANSAELAKESVKYLAKLGFPTKPLDKKILSNGVLGSSEKRLVQTLMEKSGEMVSFDEAAEAVWGSYADEKFSLYALAKLIENIRKKLSSGGVNKQIIYTIRGQGYILQN